MQIHLVLIFLFLNSCGIELPQPKTRLYAPNGLIVKNSKSGGVPAATLVLTWYGLNPEEDFSGYNIYFTNNITDATAYKGTKILSKNFNPKQATLPVMPPFTVARQFTFDIKKYYYAGGKPLFEQNREYWFFVKAFSVVKNIESPASQYYKVVFEDNLP